ncbi:hypothetical protein F4861DRAFT_538108 [Xylaria intraflava]|nr:hypothetical protein F4861DRAFT_538108 [Xylaria intraflava]
MSNTPKKADVRDLQESLRLPTEADASALLGADQVRETFRLYRNRCLVSDRRGPAQLPDWKDVDEFLYELQLSAPFRRDAGNAGSRLLDYVARLCRDKPFELMPHVAAFVLRVESFLRSPSGAVFDVARAGSGSECDVLFDRYLRIMKLLAFLVARDGCG